MDNVSASSPVDLGREKDFMLGSASIRPASRRFIANGSEEVLEPRVMQVLVLLARNAGEVVSRDDLVAKCWAGRVVGEDAINRPIAMVRKLGESSGAFSIETITRVGYRLTANGAMSVEQEISSPQSEAAIINAAEPLSASSTQLGGSSRRKVQLSIGTGLVLLIVAGVLFFRPAQQSYHADKASVAVLPFVDRNGDQAHLSAGITDALLSRLRRLDGFTVTGGEWMPKLLEQTSDPKSLGERLSVDHFLEGSVRREDNGLRISARLTAAADGHVVWTADYNRDVSDVFAIQDEIAASVANALSVALDVGVQATGYGGTKNFVAYDHYLRGRALRNASPATRPLHELEAAVVADPNYARAWSELALAYGNGAMRATSPEAIESALAQMDRASAKAESLAPNTWFVHTARGWYFIARNRWIEADAAHRRAAALDDVSDPELHLQLMAFANQVGRTGAARAAWERVASLDPQLPDRDFLAMHHYILSKDYPAAWRILDSSWRETPNNYIRESLAVWLALAEGKPERARELLRSIPSADGRNNRFADLLESKADMLGELHRLAAAEGWQSRGRLASAALYAGHYGDNELAVRLLRRAYLNPGWAGYFSIWFPQLKETRKTQEFKDFVRDVGFVDMWRKSGDWGDFCKPIGVDDFECI